ncbi:MAG TPA: DsbA family protein [Rhodospirillaceae bacterium]|nr:DsbA family protein [Rhodospirillaceae bacterium]
MTRSIQVVALLLLCAFGALPAAAAEDKPWAIDQVVGKAEAPVTVIEYSSLTCPHCAHFHVDIYPKIKSELIDSGKVKLIFRDFPLDPLAQAAAMVAHCSGPRYFNFINAFFHAQDQWAHAAAPEAAIKTIAKLGGMSPEQVDKCFEDRGLLNEINARKEAGAQKYNIDSTPSFIIGGKLFSGAMTFEEFSKQVAAQSK